MRPCPMMELQNRWYNTFTAGLRLDPAMFQFRQPAVYVGDNDAALWACQDALPPESLTFNCSGCGAGSFSDEYAALSSQVLCAGDSLANVIGDQAYEKWTDYQSRRSSVPAGNELPALFQQWAMIHVPGLAAAGASALARSVLRRTAQPAANPNQGDAAGPPAFEGTGAQLTQAAGSAPGVAVVFDNRMASPDVHDTWCGGKTTGLPGLWAGACANSRLSRCFSANPVTVDASFRGVLVWPSTPGAWYQSALLQSAYSNPHSVPWLADANPSWDPFFGAEGSLVRMTASLLVVDGMHTRVMSHAAYCDADRQLILRHAAQGLWPFYAPARAGIVTNKVRFDDTGMTVDTVTQSRNPLVIGSHVLGIAQYLGRPVV